MISALRKEYPKQAISASWDRCKYKYSLVAEASYPVMRLQSSEVTPRLNTLVEQTGGRRGVFRQVSEIALSAGHCLVLTDLDQIIVRCESKHQNRSQFERDGIALGSCWNERIAGTNGVAMALSQSDAFTVRGKDHYFSKFKKFVCTAVPLLDAHNNIVGTASLAAMDHGNAAEYLFQRQLLEQAARQIQHYLFQQHFSSEIILSVSDPNATALLPNTELIAVNHGGIVCGFTKRIQKLSKIQSAESINGQAIEKIIGMSLDNLMRNQGKNLCTQFKNGIDLDVYIPESKTVSYTGTNLDNTSSNHSYSRQPLNSTLKRLAVGSHSMRTLLEQAQISFKNNIPLLLEGETGTGKTDMVKALHMAAGGSSSNLVRIDCAALCDDRRDHFQIRQLLDYARISQALQSLDTTATTLLLENICEMPTYAQVNLRSLLETIETQTPKSRCELVTPLIRVVATSQISVRNATNDGLFLEDLFYILSGAHFVLPPLRQREGLEMLAQLLIEQLGGRTMDVSEECMTAIRRYTWPGNIRELRNTLRQSLIASNGECVSLVELARLSAVDSDLKHKNKLLTTQSDMLKDCDEKTLLLDTLVSANWNISRTSRIIGVHRSTVHRKMKQFNIIRK